MPVLSCNEATRKLSESSERTLSWSEKIALKIHLMICSACRNFGRQMHFIHDAMRAYKLGKDDKGR